MYCEYCKCFESKVSFPFPGSACTRSVYCEYTVNVLKVTRVFRFPDLHVLEVRVVNIVK